MNANLLGQFGTFISAAVTRLVVDPRRRILYENKRVRDFEHAPQTTLNMHHEP